MTSTAPRWNPHTAFVWSKDELTNWYDTFGSFAMYDGKAWKPVTVRLMCSRFEVRFVEYQPK